MTSRCFFRQRSMHKWMFCVHNKLHVCRSPDVQLLPVEFDSWTRPVLAQRYMMWLQEMVSSKVCSLPLELEGCWIFAKRMWTWMSHLAIYVQKGCRSKCQPSGDVVTWNHGRSTSFLLVLCGALTRVRWDESSLPGGRPFALVPLCILWGGGPVGGSSLLVFNMCEM